jgi:hypothetical protein
MSARALDRFAKVATSAAMKLASRLRSMRSVVGRRTGRLGRSQVRTLLALALFGLGVIGVAAQAGDYDIPWRTIDSGGGLAYGDTGYILDGTIGQPESRDLIGGPYRVQGGYWSELVTPLPRASATPSASSTATATLEVTPDPVTPTIVASATATKVVVPTATPGWRQINIPFVIQRARVR